MSDTRSLTASPARWPPHRPGCTTRLLGKSTTRLRAALEGKPCRAYIAPFDVRLPKADEANERVDTAVQPDLLVVRDETKLDERGLRGAPDWVVEVLSPATAGHDQTVKLAAYERAGVPEVWLVHPTDRVVTIYRLEGNAYDRPAIHETKGTLAVAPRFRKFISTGSACCLPRRQRTFDREGGWCPAPPYLHARLKNEPMDAMDDDRSCPDPRQLPKWVWPLSDSCRDVFWKSHSHRSAEGDRSAGHPLRRSLRAHDKES
jgi:putative restriction endonuclease